MKYFFVLLLFFLLPIVVFAQRLPTLEDEQYKTACGPIACRVALQTLGIETTLDEIAKRLVVLLLSAPEEKMSQKQNLVVNFQKFTVILNALKNPVLLIFYIEK
jgi:hypothetical protein